MYLILLQRRIDGGLFELLDYCLSFSGKNSSTSELTFSGLEVKNSSSAEESSVQILNQLTDSLTQLIFLIVESDVRNFPDSRVVHWLIFAKAVALNISVVRSSAQDGSESANPTEDKEEGRTLS